MHTMQNVINEKFTIASHLKGKLESRTSVVAVLGLGYVGLPLAVEKAKVGLFIETAAEEISLRLRPGQLVTLESTTYPGTTEEVILPS